MSSLAEKEECFLNFNTMIEFISQEIPLKNLETFFKTPNALYFMCWLPITYEMKLTFSRYNRRNRDIVADLIQFWKKLLK